MVVSKSKSFFDHKSEHWFAYAKKSILKPNNLMRVLDEFGKTVFADRVEAEAVAAKMNEEAMGGKYQYKTIKFTRGHYGCGYQADH